LLPPFSSQAATVDQGSPSLRSLGNATAANPAGWCGRPALKDDSKGLAKIARRRQGHSPHRPVAGSAEMKRVSASRSQRVIAHHKI
jgi:hypothetical protein